MIQDADAHCRRRYEQLRTEVETGGIEEVAIAKSVTRLSTVTESGVVLRPLACEPTGIALGAPFPEVVVEPLWSLATNFVQQAETLVAADAPTFAFVPSPLLHITVVNRRHFDVSSDIGNLTTDEYFVVRDVITSVVKEPITIDLRGIILTTGGRLIVPGYPTSNVLYRLRQRIVERLPQLAVNLPITVHVKLGHLLVAPPVSGANRLLKLVAMLDQQFGTTASFLDFYTPAGRIAIGRYGNG